MLLGYEGAPGFRLRWTVWTKGKEPGAERSGKCVWTIAASRGTYGASVAGSASLRGGTATTVASGTRVVGGARSEEHTSELQSLAYLVCRLLLEKKNNNRERI